MLEKTTEKRNGFLDFLRGGAILLVVFGHAIQVCMNMDISNPVHIVIRTFQMNLLMLISGYSLKYSKEGKPLVINIKNKILRLLVPYVAWAEIHYFIGVLIKSEDVCGYNPISVLCVSQFWFLRILFLIHLVYYVYKSIAAKISIRLAGIVGLLILIMISLLPGSKLVLWYAPYFLLGVALGKYGNSKYEKKYLYLARFLTLIFIGSCICLFKIKNDLCLSIIDKSMTITGSVAFSYVLYIFYIKLQDIKIIRMIKQLGVNTLPIYAIHWCLFFSYKIFVITTTNKISVYISAVMTAAIWTILCVALIGVIKKISWARKVLI